MIHRVLVGAVSDRECDGEVSADDTIIQQCLNWIGLFAADSRSYKNSERSLDSVLRNQGLT
jgi:hypothetical protein